MDEWEYQTIIVYNPWMWLEYGPSIAYLMQCSRLNITKQRVIYTYYEL